LIFLDIGMPKMDGFEAARRIRQQPWGRAIRLVALTGWGYDQDKQRAKEAGFDQHLVKPATTADLQQAFYELELRSPTLN
jgi:CheY-like chemotaxis protein